MQAYWRRALANVAILSYKEALKDFKAVLRREPGNQSAKLRAAECEKLVRRIEFERAIEVSDPPSAFADLDIDAIKVEDNYDGVRIGDEMTQEFIDDMIQRFKDGKKIHRKYVFQIIKAVKELVYNEPTMVEIGVESGKKLTVCGDTHGMYQFSSWVAMSLTSQANTSTCLKSSAGTVLPLIPMLISSMVISSTVDPGLAKSHCCSMPTSGSDLTVCS